MTKTEMLVNLEKKYHDFCIMEYNRTSIAVSNAIYPIHRKEAADNATQRILGAGEFVQSLGLDFGTVEAIFNYYKEQIEDVCGVYF